MPEPARVVRELMACLPSRIERLTLSHRSLEWRISLRW